MDQGRTLYEQGKLLESQQKFESILRLYPDSRSAMYYLQQLKESIAATKRAADLSKPDDADINYEIRVVVKKNSKVDYSFSLTGAERQTIKAEILKSTPGTDRATHGVSFEATILPHKKADHVDLNFHLSESVPPKPKEDEVHNRYAVNSHLVLEFSKPMTVSGNSDGREVSITVTPLD